MADDCVSATTVINAPAEAIFAVLADPAKHAAIDGTGWVRETLDSKPLSASAAGRGATTSGQLDPRTPQSLSPMTGQQSRTPSESTSDSRRSLRTIWATRSPTSPTSPNWLPDDPPALPPPTA